MQPVVPRVLHRLPARQACAVHDELRLLLQKLLSDWAREFQEEPSWSAYLDLKVNHAAHDLQNFSFSPHVHHCHRQFDASQHQGGKPQDHVLKRHGYHSFHRRPLGGNDHHVETSYAVVARNGIQNNIFSIVSSCMNFLFMQQIQKTLMKESGVYFLHEESPPAGGNPATLGHPLYGLINQDLNLVKPNYESMVKSGVLKINNAGGQKGIEINFHLIKTIIVKFLERKKSEAKSPRKNNGIFCKFT
jgi:hypothetical protein